VKYRGVHLYHQRSDEEKAFAIRHYGQQHVLSLSIEKEKMSKYMKIGDYEIHCWSISGIESSTVVKLTDQGDFRIAFDMGYCGREMVRAQYVFIRYETLISFCNSLWSSFCATVDFLDM
jgi:hypothetical protein